jgi:uncharacterized circularly permuted ATP-grasp superfamily protein
MPYEISLHRDPETGLDRYSIVAGPTLGEAEQHELTEWLLAASQNPTAAFVVDLSGAPELTGELCEALAVVGAEHLAGLGHTES